LFLAWIVVTAVDLSAMLLPYSRTGLQIPLAVNATLVFTKDCPIKLSRLAIGVPDRADTPAAKSASLSAVSDADLIMRYGRQAFAAKALSGIAG
jgi:hypothetical protein